MDTIEEDSSEYKINEQNEIIETYENSKQNEIVGQNNLINEQELLLTSTQDVDFKKFGETLPRKINNIR